MGRPAKYPPEFQQEAVELVLMMGPEDVSGVVSGPCSQPGSSGLRRTVTTYVAVLEHPMCGNPACSGSGNHVVCEVPEHELGGSR
jgi:hypothetical protein